jgi:hypothetical protein
MRLARGLVQQFVQLAFEVILHHWGHHQLFVIIYFHLKFTQA